MKRRRPRPEDFTIGWICPLPLEYAAAKGALDELYDEAEYTTGRIHNHDIVITCLPAGRTGVTAAAIATEKMLATFPSIKHGLLVGIAGGVPSEKADIRLGDVVIGQPDGQYGGVVQYDFGKTIPGGFQRTGSLNGPSNALLTAVAKLRSNLTVAIESIQKVLVNRPPDTDDLLFRASYNHTEGDRCSGCSAGMLVQRARRDEKQGIFFGTIASGNQVVKDGLTRDEHNARLGGVLCFEMEAAGIANLIPCLVIRGICDYADSHKHKSFQPFAAAAAAACARQVLLYLPCAPTSRYSESAVAATSQFQTSTEVPARQGVAEARLACLESLKFDQLDSRHQTIKIAHIKTCRWLLSSPDYKDWLNAEHFERHHGFFWIKGKPGAGKSTLMKYAFTQALRHMKDTTVLSFFFNARGELLEKTVAGMYRSLLVQLLRKLPDLQCVFDTLPTAAAIEQGHDWKVENLKPLLLAAVEKLDQRSVVCYIDALDECDEEQVRDMLSFFEQLGEVAILSQVQLHVCFSSRHYPHVTIDHKIELVLEDQDGHQQDIANYVHSELKAGRSKQAEHIKEEVIQRASGIFLWVVLVVQILRKEYDCGRVHALKRRLAEIPNGLHELLKDILVRDNQSMRETLLCLQWILYAKRPLRREELYFAILAGIEADPIFLTDWIAPNLSDEDFHKFILNASKGLAELSRSKKAPTVQFIHESVRDFLRDEGLNTLDLGNMTLGPSHEALKRCCFNYMTIDVSTHLPPSGDLPTAKSSDAQNLVKTISQLYPFLEYAVENVFYHADAAAEHQVPQESFSRSFSMSDWIMKRNIFEKHQIRRYSPSADKMYIFAELNLPRLIAAEITMGSHVVPSSERYGHPLQTAVAHGSAEAVAVLLASDISLRGTLNQMDVAGVPLLKFACRRNMLAIISLICQAGADVNRRDVWGRTPLFYAAMHGYESAVKTLLAHNADVNLSDTREGTPLFEAVTYNHTAVVKLLLDNGAKIDVERSRGDYSPLHRVSQRGREAMAQLLIQRGANIEARDRIGDVPLLSAVDARSLAVAKLLLDNGANIEATNKDGRTPLHQASRRGHEAMARLLIERGANIEAKDANGRTPLFCAWPDTIACIRLLIDSGAEVNSKDVDGFTPLFDAAEFGSVELVNTLLDSGAYLEARDDKWRTAFSNGVRRSRNDALEVLLDRGAYFESRDIYGRTPLANAVIASKGFLVRDRWIKRLLDIPANIEAEDYSGRTPLSHAATLDGSEVANFLLTRGADKDTKDYLGMTPLLHAVAARRLEIIKLLLENGADPYVRGPDGLTATEHALAHDFQELEKVLEPVILRYPARLSSFQ